MAWTVLDSWDDHVLDEPQYPLVKRIEIENPLEMERLLDVRVVKSLTFIDRFKPVPVLQESDWLLAILRDPLGNSQIEPEFSQEAQIPQGALHDHRS